MVGFQRTKSSIYETLMTVLNVKVQKENQYLVVRLEGGLLAALKLLVYKHRK